MFKIYNTSQRIIQQIRISLLLNWETKHCKHSWISMVCFIPDHFTLHCSKIKCNLKFLAYHFHAFLCTLLSTCVLSRFSRVWHFVTLWTAAHKDPLSMEFSRQEYCSGLPCLPRGDLPDPGIEQTSLKSPALTGGFFTASTTWELWCWRRLKPVSPKENQSWLFIGNTDAAAEAPILWPLDEKGWLIRKDPDARKDWKQEKKGMTEDEMVGRHHRLNEHKFEQASGVGDGQGSLTCCSPWGHKDSDRTEQLNWTTFGKTSNLPYIYIYIYIYIELYLYHLYIIISVTHKNVNIPKEKKIQLLSPRFVFWSNISVGDFLNFI